jgi:hypothetical protein
MIIAIYHNQDIHIEMLGYIIEYCNNYNIKIHIYCTKTLFYNNGKSWLRWYNSFFNLINYEIINLPTLIETVKYDAVILLTDDNPDYNTYKIRDKYHTKTICIDHWFTTRCKSAAEFVCTRVFFNRPDAKYAFPCFNIISGHDKKLILAETSRIRVLFIGRFNNPSSLNFLYFDNFDNIDFHIINDKMDIYSEFLKLTPNMYVHKYLEAHELIDLMNKSHYIFFNPSYIEGYPQHKTSGSLHLAFSTLCVPIIPTSWNTHYKFKSVVEYDDLEFLRPNRQLKLSIEDFNKRLELLECERQHSISHRNTVFDKALKKITGIDTIIENNSSWISQCFAQLMMIKPKVLVQIGMYENVGDFREIYIISDTAREEVYKNVVQRCHLETVIYNIHEPAVFLIKGCVDISDRKYDDIIITDSNETGPHIKKLSNGLSIIFPKYNIIEKTIFQVCISPFNIENIPLHVFENVKAQSGPGMYYDYMLYNDEMVGNLLSNCGEVVSRKYNECARACHKKDIIMMILLYNYGGLYFDIDQEPLVHFDEMIKDASFVGLIPVKKEDGLAIGFLGCSRYNEIVKMIFEEFINLDMAVLDNYYILLCKIAGQVLIRYMGVDELHEGVYHVNGQKIILLSEQWDGPEDYYSCRAVFNGRVMFNCRYKDYPW